MLQDLFVVIPARGGSQGIPRKNIKPLGGLPLIGWSAQALQAAGMGGARCILSTDDAEIATVGRDLGLEVPFLRPADIATSTASMVDVGLHALDWLESTGGSCRVVLMLLPTHPFRDPAQMRAALDLFADPEVDGVMSVMPIHRSLSTLFHLDERKVATPLGERKKAEQRQQIKPIFTPSGCFFYATAQALREQETFYTRNVRAVETEVVESWDLDTLDEWAVAEAMIGAGLTWRK